MAVSRSNFQVAAGGNPVVWLDARVGDANAIIIRHAQLRIDHNAEPVLVGLIGIIVISDARIIGKRRGIISRNAAALAVHVTEIPIGYNISVFGRLTEKLDRAVEVPAFIGFLGLL